MKNKKTGHYFHDDQAIVSDTSIIYVYQILIISHNCSGSLKFGRNRCIRFRNSSSSKRYYTFILLDRYKAVIQEGFTRKHSIRYTRRLWREKFDKKYLGRGYDIRFERSI